MKRACIATIDAASARLFQYEETDGRAPELREIGDLTNPGRREREHDLFSDSKGSRSPSFGWGSTNDHREAHIAHWDHAFAKLVVTEIDRVAHDLGMAHVILVAPPRMLGTLRPLAGVLRRPGGKLDEIERDLGRFSPSQIHDHLAALHVIEPRHRAFAVQR